MSTYSIVSKTDGAPYRYILSRKNPANTKQPPTDKLPDHSMPTHNTNSDPLQAEAVAGKNTRRYPLTRLSLPQG